MTDAQNPAAYYYDLIEELYRRAALTQGDKP